MSPSKTEYYWTKPDFISISTLACDLGLLWDLLGMGNVESVKKQRIDHASKTGVLSMENLKLQKFPPEVMKVDPGRLKTLSFTNNLLLVMPSEYCRFTALKKLDLNRNKLSSLPLEYAAMRKLESLNLSDNNFREIPAVVLKFTGMKTLSLGNNKITVVPEGLAVLTKLSVLDLSANKISAFPADCGQYNCLEINLDRNQIPTIPVGLKGAAKLRVLRLDENTVSANGIPGEFLQESSISLLSLEGNPIQQRQLQNIEGYAAYQARYTKAKQKM